MKLAHTVLLLLLLAVAARLSSCSFYDGSELESTIELDHGDEEADSSERGVSVLQSKGVAVEQPKRSSLSLEIAERIKQLDGDSDPLGIRVSVEDLLYIHSALASKTDAMWPLSLTDLPASFPPTAASARVSVNLLITGSPYAMIFAPLSLQPGRALASTYAHNLAARTPIEGLESWAAGCLAFNLDVSKSNAHLSSVTTKGCGFSGTLVVKLFLYLSKALGFQTGTLLDQSKIECTVEDSKGQRRTQELSLLALSLLTYGKSWYGRFGFTPESPPEKDVAAVLADPTLPKPKVQKGAFSGRRITDLVPELFKRIRAGHDSQACAALASFEPLYVFVLDFEQQRKNAEPTSLLTAWQRVAIDLTLPLQL
eukprot:gnl/Hemi2/2746_TR966_c0_g1_i1.p1 gnl/Hemi2/2746_TR966_c0_g1~~gnl/Hemi2/2746_TR966_c0_g1_i1.p1  ORF type:complete len:369 (-),score=67.31 gnl/Hemi2/2746_TR966_c0_g1_i1:86-1192(-)